MNNKETEIATLGEFGLIDHLTKGVAPKNNSTLKGVGDDCAVIDTGGNTATLITTDLLLEGIHFDLTYCPLKHLGYKAAVVNFSDVYAMNGKGIKLACEVYGVDLVGGDTSASVTGLIISITCIGEGEKGKIVFRNGAKDTDLICVSGDLGAAYMGLQLLEREKAISKNAQDQDFSPAFEGHEYILERQLKPEARKDIIATLAEHGIMPTAMIDISDGLSSELMHICKQSSTGCLIYEERIPIDYQTAFMAEEFNLKLVTASLNAG